MIDKLIKELTFEEKTKLITGGGGMETYAVERLGIKAKKFADGPHGVRTTRPEANCTHFPNSCCVGATWDKELGMELGRALAKDCIHNGVDMLLGPGINIIKNPLCGRNFEYMSEDPVVAGEMAAAYINGVQSLGVGTSLKHFAVNNQEMDRLQMSADVDERTLREIYLKGFEIAVKKAQPTSVMCAYNKVNAVWCSENKYLLETILKDEWGYEGYVVSDWGAVQNTARAFNSGMDLQMPKNDTITEELKKAVEEGKITEEQIDKAVRRVLKFILAPVDKNIDYDRDEQHKIARKVAATGTVMLKNEDNVLPLTKEKYKKIAIIGEYADKPLTCGQGSAEVYQKPEYTDSAVEELKKLLPECEIKYEPFFHKSQLPTVMQWPRMGDVKKFVEDADIVLLFVGNMESEDTENFDRVAAEINPNYYMYMKELRNKNLVVVLQNGSAIVPRGIDKYAKGIFEMWLGGEAAGGGIADVLCGVVNPSGKLAQTFPTKERIDMDYPGDGLKATYSEGLDVGYRYYDKHPEEIAYPFGYGLSYTTFDYSNIDLKINGDNIDIAFDLTNTGKCAGAEVVQIYVNDPQSVVPKSPKELKAFDKVFLESGETKRVEISIPVDELAYYNIMLRDWVVEDGLYNIYVGASSRDIKLKGQIMVKGKTPYTMTNISEAMIG